ncbi:MAG: hypothetical protein BWK73_34545, partial [Thiothrix lacustris]
NSYTNTTVASEATARIAGDAALQSDVDAVEGRMTTAEGDIDTLQSGLTAETTARIGGDGVLQRAIDNEAAIRAAADVALGRATSAAQTTADNAQNSANAALGVANGVANLAVNANMAAQQGLGMASEALDVATLNSIDISGIKSSLTNRARRDAEVDAQLSNSVPFDGDGGLTLSSDENGIATGGIHNVADAEYRYDAVNLGQMQAADASVLHQANDFSSAGVAASLAMPSVGIEPGKTKGFGVSAGHYAGKSAVGAGFATKLGNGRLDLGLSGVQGGEAATKVGYSLSW